MVERLLAKQKVAGSNPVSRSIFNNTSWCEIEDAINQFRDAGVRYPIWIMPVGATEESQNKDHVSKIAEETMDRGYNVAARVHCYIWGNQIGT